MVNLHRIPALVTTCLSVGSPEGEGSRIGRDVSGGKRGEISGKNRCTPRYHLIFPSGVVMCLLWTAQVLCARSSGSEYLASAMPPILRAIKELGHESVSDSIKGQAEASGLRSRLEVSVVGAAGGNGRAPRTGRTQ